MINSFYRSKTYRQLSCLSTTFKTIYRNIRGVKFEQEVYALSKFIPAGGICFDLGAGYGRYTLVMSGLAGRLGHIYSFEPGNYSYKILSNVVKFYRLKNVTVIKKALSNKISITQLVLPIKKSGKIGFSLAHLGIKFDSNCIVEEVEITTLDDYCSKINIPRVDFIKCDVEGTELSVFKGAKNVISCYKPTVLCEIAEEFSERFDSTPDKIFDFFCQMGYRASIFKNDKFENVDSIKKGICNYFFVHTQTVKEAKT